MNPALKRTADRIDAMNLRERAMLMAIVLLLLWALWHMLLMAPLVQRNQARSAEIAGLSTQVAALNQSVQSIAAEQSRDPQAEARRNLEAIAAQQRDVDMQIEQATSGLIAPRDMGAVLESILARQQGLRLAALHSLDPEPVDLGSGLGVAPLYRHGMAIEVEGSYLDLLGFLRSLEALPWEFIWRGLQIETGEHPRSRMRLTLYTLSLSEGWLGV